MLPPCRVESVHAQLAVFVGYAHVFAIAAGKPLESGIETSYMESELSGLLAQIKGTALLSTGPKWLGLI